MWLIKLCAEPPVQHFSFAARAAAHSGIWLLWLVLMQCAVTVLIALLRKLHLKQHSSPPKLSAAHMLGESILGYSSWTFMLGAFAAWVNPGAPGGWQWDYSCPNLLAVAYFSLAVLMLYDAYSYFLHKWMHDNKTAFRIMHRKHHEVKAMLNVMTSGYMAAAEGVFSSAIPMCVLYALGVATGNWWYTAAGLWNSFSLVMLGHCGAVITLNDLWELPVLLLNPILLLYLQTPCHSSPMDHADHHTIPSKNYSFFFTYWDDLYGSSRHKQPPCSLLVLSAHALYQLALLGSFYLWTTQFRAALAVCAVCYWLVPPTTAAAAAEKLQLAQLTRSALGWAMDAYRTDNCITYAARGEPGVLSVPAAAAAAAQEPSSVDLDAPPRAVSTAKDQRNSEPVYLFACHPAGLLSRAAFCTFAARGWCSPVSGLRQVRLAVGSQALRLPIAFIREFLLACGCIPADRVSIRNALRSGCSVAITPGGWREGGLFGSYKLIIKQRRGFVQLAHETGVLLVPVLCLGEQDLAQAPINGPILWGFRLVQTFRPQPVKVVFGQVLSCEEGESIEKLHSRYMQALSTLGREHGVQLELV